MKLWKFQEELIEWAFSGPPPLLTDPNACILSLIAQRARHHHGITTALMYAMAHSTESILYVGPAKRHCYAVQIAVRTMVADIKLEKELSVTDDAICFEKRSIHFCALSGGDNAVLTQLQGGGNNFERIIIDANLKSIGAVMRTLGPLIPVLEIHSIPIVCVLWMSGLKSIWNRVEVAVPIYETEENIESMVQKLDGVMRVRYVD